MFQLQGGYTLSVFVNDFPWVRADNPCNGNGVTTIAGGCAAPGTSGQFGTTSLPPNNQAHTFNLQGGVNLPMRTRVNANFTYQLRFQNQDFQQQTYSNGLVAANPSLQLPQSSLNGNVQTALFNLDATSRPLQAPVTFTLKYRLYDYMDNSDTISIRRLHHQRPERHHEPRPTRAGRYSFLQPERRRGRALPVHAEHRSDPGPRLGGLEPEPRLRGDGEQRGPRQGGVRLHAYRLAARPAELHGGLPPWQRLRHERVGGGQRESAADLHGQRQPADYGRGSSTKGTGTSRC